MLLHTYHGGDVWEVRDRLGPRIAYLLNGPAAPVQAVVDRIMALWPDTCVVSSVVQAQQLEVILHRTASDCGGMPLAA